VDERNVDYVILHHKWVLNSTVGGQLA